MSALKQRRKLGHFIRGKRGAKYFTGEKLKSKANYVIVFAHKSMEDFGIKPK